MRRIALPFGGLILIALAACGSPEAAPPLAPPEETAMAQPKGPAKVERTDEEWRKLLTPEQYRILRDDIDRLVGGINADVGRIGAQPITYVHASFPREEMAALYRAADVMVVTPLRDGMNLVAKEYVACRFDDTGALVLSEFAGAAAELKQAYQVNPYDINGMKATMLEATQAPPRELARRMRAMRRIVTDHVVPAR